MRIKNIFILGLSSILTAPILLLSSEITLQDGLKILLEKNTQIKLAESKVVQARCKKIGINFKLVSKTFYAV